MSDASHTSVSETPESDLRLCGQEAMSNVWQEMGTSSSFVFDGLSLRDSSGVEIARRAGNTWLLGYGRKMLGLSFEADRNISVKAVGRGELLLNADGADGAVRVNGASLVVNGHTVLVLDGLGRWSQPSNSRSRFRVVVIG